MAAKHGAKGPGRLALMGLAAFIALLLVMAAVAVSLAGRSRQEAHSPAESPAPADTLLFNDPYAGQRTIPLYDYPTNEYDPDSFAKAGEFIQYPGAVLGVDVSEHQQTVDWQAVRDAGVEFAMLRVGFRGMTEGLLNVDSTFAQNYQGATEAGLRVGVYFFSQAVTEQEAREEAAFVLDALEGRQLQYPVAFDWETPIPSEELPAEDLRAHNIPGETVTACALAFCQEVEAAGYSACVYTNKDMAYNAFDLTRLGDYPLWYAEYQPAPSLYYGFRIWQYSAEGTVPGIEGSVDLNLCFEPY